MEELLTFECRSWRRWRATFHLPHASCVIDGKYYTMPSRARDLLPGIQGLRVSRRRQLVVTFFYPCHSVRVGPLRRRFVLNAVLVLQRHRRQVLRLRARRLAFVMGFHPPLGAKSPLRVLTGCREITDQIFGELEDRGGPRKTAGDRGGVTTRSSRLPRLVLDSWRVIAVCLDVTCAVLQNIADLFSPSSG